MFVNSIFQSINGEVCRSSQGSLCTFLRLQGCNLEGKLQCPYCDTPDSLKAKSNYYLNSLEIFDKILSLPYKTKYLTITGGEPLLQQFIEFEQLLHNLLQHYSISIETNGTIRPSSFIRRTCSVVMDFKPHLNYVEEFLKVSSGLHVKDWIKVPVRNDEDFEKGIKVQKIIKEMKVNKARWAWSPISPMSPNKLYQLMMENDRMEDVLNVQIHKQIKMS